MNNPLTRTTALETHPSWKAHDMNLHTASEGFDALERTGGFPLAEYDGAGRLDIPPCRHSRYWDSVSSEASERFTQDVMSDAEATQDARRAAPGYFRHP